MLLGRSVFPRANMIKLGITSIEKTRIKDFALGGTGNGGNLFWFFGPIFFRNSKEAGSNYERTEGARIYQQQPTTKYKIINKNYLRLHLVVGYY